ncbi:phosphonate C-P lyase system protein PhnH [Citreimonas salinaria]|uniref:Alpha-D-ribose 1-methylphosphonate 5-triphosphate synthase subunit PhnH n=1 Tax=Citreimonas salinaria TaxID=321339 RepID=A0A1H3IS90_9RHOB|nr:phosphonate C-P lyase system protein PhnH [Citreimonas salinaria]SDY30616.1 alpha-D-ribose 1-methylphosphonate 5-triphosphate synthase subunit PhnH [Citreimonas salinaria]
MDATTLQGGFATPPVDAAHAFRAVMEAMARPGTIHPVSGAKPPAPLSVAAGVVLLTLCDAGMPVHLAGAMDCDAVRAWIAFHTGAPLTGPADCAFALGEWDALTPLDRFPVGTSEYPDRSATLIVERPSLEPVGVRLNGPGIRETAALSLPETRAFRKNAARFPLGLDFVFTCGDRLAALPRSTTVTEPEMT